MNTFFDENKKMDRPYPNYVFSTSAGVYDCMEIQSLYYLTFWENIKNDALVPNLDKIDELKKLNEDSNPVIFYYSYD